ncbi:hypothetical protein AEA09_14540 [Lysinibacillus contaminans]|uniref:Lipoprotein n=1 Tax=Lysinibacillus contaminans TaxID=1293441 RepID=A0ABR5K449_9BACI|nr:hypothetical protein [Lysinibacillus contaminans]KOS69673.1 hypothetical protein AEA09_14540 [Lysinibacillus contaminans]
MQKKLLSMLALLLTAILVVGCNTSDKTEDSDISQNDPSNSASQQTPSDSESVDETQETPEQTGSATNTPSTQEQEITYVQKGADKKATATESQSVDQGYKLHQLPGFTLSQEEPGKDIIVSNEDDEVFMRIESVSTTDTSFDNVKSSLVDYMNAVGDTTPLSPDELGVFKDAKKVEGYVVDFDTEKVVGVVIEKDGLIVKLTIHDNNTQDLTAAMLAMAATITQK